MKLSTLTRPALGAALGVLGLFAVMAAGRDTDAVKFLRKAFD